MRRIKVGVIGTGFIGPLLELVKIARERKLVNATHFNLRFYPLVEHARQLIQMGELGRILTVNRSYQQDWL